MTPIGPPFPGETLVIYDGTKVYWDITLGTAPGTLKFTAANGTVVKINRETGAIIP
jgi:hypothetical protein